MLIKNLLTKMSFDMDGQLALLHEFFGTEVAAELLHHLLISFSTKTENLYASMLSLMVISSTVVAEPGLSCLVTRIRGKHLFSHPPRHL